MPDSQYGILQILEEVSWGGLYKLATQGFVHIMVQLESPAAFATDTDGLGNLCCGGRGTMDQRSCGVEEDSKICGGCGGGVLDIGHQNIKVTVDSSTEWREGRCHVVVELGTGSSDALEGGVYGSTRNGCQDGERDVRDDGFGDDHGGENKDSVIGGWEIFGRVFSSHTEDREKNEDYSALLMRSTDK